MQRALKRWKLVGYVEDGNIKDSWRTQKVGGEISIQGTHKGRMRSVAFKTYRGHTKAVWCLCCLWEIDWTHGGRKHTGHLEYAESRWRNSNTEETHRTHAVCFLRDADCLLTGHRNFHKGWRTIRLESALFFLISNACVFKLYGRRI